MKKILLILMSIYAIFIIISCTDRSIIQYKDNNNNNNNNIKDYDLSSYNIENLRKSGFRMISQSSSPPFSIDDPNTTSFFPKSETGHISSSPFYLYNFKEDNKDKAKAWWLPVNGDAGVYHVSFIVTNSGGLSDKEEVQITVLEGNDPPIIMAKFEIKKIIIK